MSDEVNASPPILRVAVGSRPQIIVLAERDGWLCNGCGEEMVEHDDNLPLGPMRARYATVDHKDPKGGNDPSNLWLMCASCNSSKGQRPLEEWEKTLDFEGGFLKRGFTQIPNALLFDATVSVGARMTLICLMQFAWKGDPFPGQKALGEMLGVTDRTVRDYLVELRDSGYINVYRRGRGKTNVYRIVQLKLMKAAEESSVEKKSDRKQTSALDRNQGSYKEYEVEEDEEKHLAATPPNGSGNSKPRPRNEVWEALEYVFGPVTAPTALSKRGKVCRDLQIAHATRDQIVARASAWPAHFDSATLTPEALEKHWDTLARKPLRRQ